MILLLLGRILQIALAVFQIRLVTTLLNPSQYGTWILLQTVVSFLVMFCLSPLGLYLNRHIIDWEKENLMPEIFRSYSLFLFLFSFISIFFFGVIQSFGLVNLHGPSILLTSLIMSFFLFSQTFHQTWVPALNFFGKRKEFVIGSALAILLGLVIVFILSLFGFKSAEAWGISMSLGFLASTFIFIPKDWYMFNRERFAHFKKNFHLKNVFHFSMPLLFSTFFIWFQTQGYRFIIERKIGITTFGQFAAGYAVVAGLFAALEAVLTSFYQPRFYQGISKGEEVHKELTHVWSIAIYPYLLAGCFLFLLAPEIAKIFLHKDFITDTKWISWVVMAEGLRVLFNLVCINFHGTKKTLSIAWPHFLGAAFTFSLLMFRHDLAYIDLLLCLGAGYLLSIIILLFVDFKNYYNSQFFSKLTKAVLFCVLYFMIGLLVAHNLEGIKKIAALSLLGFVFIIPFYLKNVKEVN